MTCGTHYGGSAYSGAGYNRAYSLDSSVAYSAAQDSTVSNSAYQSGYQSVEQAVPVKNYSVVDAAYHAMDVESEQPVVSVRRKEELVGRIKEELAQLNKELYLNQNYN